MAVFNTFTFDGENSLDYGVYITGEAVYNAPERAVEMVSIPGKNGALALDQGRFENIEVTYPAGMFGVKQAEFAGRMRAMRNMLASRYNYVRLTDSYHPDEYRLGLYKNGLEATPVAMSSAGEFNITFNCKPQRFLTSGDDPFVVGDWEDITTETDEVVTFEGTEETAFKSLSAEFTYDQDGTPWKAPDDEKSPYLLRRSGGGSIGHDFNAEVDKIIGGTVAWNQLVHKEANRWSIYGGTATISLVDDVLEINATTDNVSVAQYYRSSSTFIAGHKYLSYGEIRSSVAGMTCGPYNGSPFESVTTTTEWIKRARIVFPSNQGSAFTGVAVVHGANTGTLYIRNMMVIDLTQMFGTEIADYVNSLEQTTSGAGVAWLRNHGFIDGSYRAYDSGSLQSVKTSAHRTVGFNQWDEEWELGRINIGPNATGLNESDTTRIRAKNYIPLIVSAEYYVKFPTGANIDFNFAYYDENKTYIKRNSSQSYITSNGKLTNVPTNARYIRFYMGAGYGTTYNHDICINISDASKNRLYEPYESHSYPLDSDLELRGIPKLSNGSLYYDGDAYESSGAVTRKYSIVDLGTLTYGRGGVDNKCFATDGLGGLIKPAGWSTEIFNGVFSNGYICTTGSNVYSLQHDRTAGLDGNGLMYIYDSSKESMTTSDFKTAMSGVYLVYELATPTTEQADPYASPQVVNPLGTEEYIDTRDVPVPVGHETRYHVEADIIGRTDVNIYVSPTEDESDATVYNEALGRTAYGGSVDLISGVLTTDTGYIASYNGETIATPWVSSLEPYASGTTPSVGAQVVYPITPVTYQLTPQEVEVLLGTNYVWSDGEAVTIEYGERLNSIINPTPFDSQPLVKVTGAGVLGIGDYTVTITGDADQVIFIDCESMEIYKNTGGIITPASSLVSFATNEFPVLPEGKTSITMGTGITGCEIIPRWWII